MKTLFTGLQRMVTSECSRINRTNFVPDLNSMQRCS